MDDKEVGKLWRANRFPNVNPTEIESVQQEAIIALIRKLVRERIEFLSALSEQTRSDSDCLTETLRDFGISRESWESSITVSPPLAPKAAR